MLKLTGAINLPAFTLNPVAINNKERVIDYLGGTCVLGSLSATTYDLRDYTHILQISQWLSLLGDK